MSDTTDGKSNAAQNGRESIDHIRELLVGSLVRTLNEQIDELKSVCKRSETGMRDGLDEVERKLGRSVSDIRDQFTRQVEAQTERFSQRLEAAIGTQTARTGELEDRLAETAQALESVDKRVREEFAARIEEVVSQGRDQSAKLAGTITAKTGYLETRLTQQRDAVDEELETLRRSVDKRAGQLQDEIKSSMGFISDELKRAIHEAVEAVKGETAESLDHQNRRINALKNDTDEAERRFRAELEQKANDISSRINKRLDAMDTTLANRVQDVENRSVQMQERLTERLAHAQSASDAMQKEVRGLKDSLGALVDERLKVLRDDLDRRKANREDIGNVLIELGLRFRKEAGAPELVVQPGEGASMNLLEAMLSGAELEDGQPDEVRSGIRVVVEPQGSRNGESR